jgi:hypothetical protein
MAGTPWNITPERIRAIASDGKSEKISISYREVSFSSKLPPLSNSGPMILKLPSVKSGTFRQEHAIIRLVIDVNARGNIRERQRI